MIRKPEGLGEYAAMLTIWIGLLLLFGALARAFDMSDQWKPPTHYS